MKTEKITVKKEMIERLYFYYKFNHMIQLGSAVIEDDMQWNSHNYKESHFSSIKSRDPWVEQRLMTINAMLIDYHYNRPVELDYNICSGQWLDVTVDENPEESQSILLEAQELVVELFQVLCKGNWMSKMDYVKLTLSMIFETYKLAEELHEEHNPWRKIRHGRRLIREE